MSGKCGSYAAYIKGCRCDDCRDANRSYQRDYYHRRKLSDATTSGPYEPAGIDEGDVSWMKHGACRDAGTSVFFPGSGEVNVAARAKQLCAGCPVRHECLDYALRTAQRYGIWGGLTYSERGPLRREYKNAEGCPDCGADISERAASAVYCRPCADERLRQAGNRASSRYYHSFKWENGQVAS